MPTSIPSPRTSQRAQRINGSGIRQVVELGQKLTDPSNFSIGQPDFPVPDAIKQAAVDAIMNNKNGYSLSAGIPELREALIEHVRRDVGWDDFGLMVTSGTSGGLMLSAMAMLDPGDELIIPDPYFVLYPYMSELCGARGVKCDTYPDFILTAERVERLITPRTKAVLTCSPGNPAGVVASAQQQRDLHDLCRRKNLTLISDEIYDEFVYSEARTENGRPPSPCRIPGSQADTLLIRGFGKTYGITGWRLGYAAGPKWLIAEMTKLQQYTYVCPPTPLQYGAIAALSVDMQPTVDEYQKRRDLVCSMLGRYANIPHPGGAFYAFVEVPKRLGITSTQFFQQAYERNTLIVPGKTFSERDTHFRLSFATAMPKLLQGLDVLSDLMTPR
jgi:aspartate/methionine/tyrosine aminotransferase